MKVYGCANANAVMGESGRRKRLRTRSALACHVVDILEDVLFFNSIVYGAPLVSRYVHLIFLRTLTAIGG